MDIKIIVAAHKPYAMPTGEMYLPVFVGAANSDLDLPYRRDDEGDNISSKNDLYCELTAVYWAYKNLQADYIGLNHYRRYFKGKDKYLSQSEAENLLQRSSVILPVKRHYYIETVYEQFVHSHGKESLDAARKVIKEDYPEYLSSFDMVMKRRSLHLYNMMIMRKDIFDDYCSFLFDVLAKVEGRIERKERILGFLAERLMDVYIETRKIEYQEVFIYNTEVIDWPKKIFSFLKKKITYRGE